MRLHIDARTAEPDAFHLEPHTLIERIFPRSFQLPS
jgi:hypothetical protein